MLEHVDSGTQNSERHPFVIYSKNCCLSSDLRVAQLLGELNSVATWDVITLCETRAPPREVVLDGNHKLFLARGEYITSGVGILVHQRYADVVSNFVAHSDRLCSVDIVVGKSKMRIFVIYVPHAGYPFPEFEHLIDLAMDLISKAHQLHFHVMIGGHFNCQLDVGIRGSRLREMCVICYLRIANELLDGADCSDIWTFESSMGVRRQLDFILASAKLPVIITEATRAIDMGSDHRAVKAVYHITMPRQIKKKQKRVRG